MCYTRSMLRVDRNQAYCLPPDLLTASTTSLGLVKGHGAELGLWVIADAASWGPLQPCLHVLHSGRAWLEGLGKLTSWMSGSKLCLTEKAISFRRKARWTFFKWVMYFWIIEDVFSPITFLNSTISFPSSRFLWAAHRSHERADTSRHKTIFAFPEQFLLHKEVPCPICHSFSCYLSHRR